MRRGGGSHPIGIEGENADFPGTAVSRDFFAIEQETNPGGVTRAHDDFVAGANRCVGGRDQGFFRGGLAVGRDYNPRCLISADQQNECARRAVSRDAGMSLRHREFNVRTGGDCGRLIG